MNPEPDYMIYVYGGILALAILGVPTLVTTKMVAVFTGPNRFIIRPPGGWDKFALLPREITRFIAAHGLTLTDALHYAQIPFAIFREPPGPPPERYFVVMLAGQKHVCDFVTNFSADTSLTTTQGSHAFMFPRPPGSFMQGFTKVTLEQQWAKHLEGELYLLEHKLVTGQPNPDETKDIALHIETAMRKQGALIKGIPFYWLRAIGWYFVTRHRMVNQSIAQQHPAHN